MEDYEEVIKALEKYATHTEITNNMIHAVCGEAFIKALAKGESLTPGAAFFDTWLTPKIKIRFSYLPMLDDVRLYPERLKDSFNTKKKHVSFNNYPRPENN